MDHEPPQPQSTQTIKVGQTDLVPLGALRHRSHLAAMILKHAGDLARDPVQEVILLLQDPGIAPASIEEERRLLHNVLRPEIRRRLHLVESRSGILSGLPRDVSPQLRDALTAASRAVSAGEPLGGPDYFFVISQLLIRQYLSGAGPVTSTWLQQSADCNYRTVVVALSKLGAALTRHKDRRIELTRFPRDAWARMVATADESRHTMRFVDRSGQPRSPDHLLRRLKNLALPAVAVGGVHGAIHHFPDLDLVGAPHLDLTVHATGRAIDLDWVRRLDPALGRSTDPHAAPALVLHFIRSRDTFFTVGRDHTAWADPVECLLDLHEARLEQQADQFHQFLISRRTTASQDTHG